MPTGSLLRRHPDTQLLVRIATDTLNCGLRPHLTRWQAEYRNWWEQQEEALKQARPQDVQKQFPHYALLVEEILEVNEQLIEYADELEKLVHGEAGIGD